jgi:DNA polymerase-1
MVDLSQAVASSGLKARLLLQVHDELLFEVSEDQAESLSAVVRKTMEGAIPLSVPLPVSIGRGADWVEAHPT